VNGETMNGPTLVIVLLFVIILLIILFGVGAIG
jgi:hypothetical protein